VRSLALATAATLAVGTAALTATPTTAPEAAPDAAPVAVAVPHAPDDMRLAKRASRSYRRHALRHAQRLAAARARERKQAAARARQRAAQAHAAVTSAGGYPAVWDRVAHCESTDDWAANTGNGYLGGLQITASNAAHYGFASPDTLPPAEQVRLGSLILRDQGPGAWPVCGPANGLTMAYAAA
jgi:hypothetical protein